MKKVLLSIFCVFYVPVTAFLFRIFDPMDPHPHFNPRFWISGLIYIVVIFYCLSFLLQNRPAKKSIFLSLLIGGITLGYGMPFEYLPQFCVCSLAGIATALCFLQITSPAWHTNSYFDWKQKGWKTNIILLSAVTFFYFFLFLISIKNGLWSFSLSGTFSALAAGISEEFIFHVFFPILIFTHLKLNDTSGNRIWVFLIISIPFSLIHLNYYDSICLEKVIDLIVNSALHVGFSIFLVNKYGILYGIYAHFLCDFISLNSTVG